jgi:hypothetical protein
LCTRVLAPIQGESSHDTRFKDLRVDASVPSSTSSVRGSISSPCCCGCSWTAEIDRLLTLCEHVGEVTIPDASAEVLTVNEQGS